MKLPKLYHKSKTGDLRQWSIWTEGSDIVTEYGQVNGKLQQSRKKAVAKNVGRSNQTTPEQQASTEAESLWRFKVERKYSETPEAAQEELRLPMLAHDYNKKQKKVTYPAFIQPKLDGMRCLAQWDGSGHIHLTSRAGKTYIMPHIEKQLESWLPEDMVLDGELYYHGMTCQQITSYVRKWQPGSEKIQYHIYDAPIINGDETLTYEERLVGLARSTPPINDNDEIGGPNLIAVNGWHVKSYDDVMKRHGQFIEEGYEGAILRLYHGRYLWGYRSSELLKVKEFQDAEFEVIGAKEGRGKMAGCVVWTCLSKNEQSFDCSMKVTMDERRQMYMNRDKYIGKSLTVRYFNLTDDGVPRFPVGIVFRDERDL